MHNFFVSPVETFGASLVPHEETCTLWLFFRSRRPNWAPEMSLSYLQNMTTYYPLWKYILSICFSLKYCYFVHNNSEFVHLKTMVRCMLQKHKEMFQHWIWQQFFIKSFTCNNATVLVCFLNEILFVH